MNGDFVIQMPSELRSSSGRMQPLETEDTVKFNQTGITCLTVRIPLTSRTGPRSTQSRWRTPEFMLYYLTAIVCVPLMIWIPITLGSSTLVSSCHKQTLTVSHSFSPQLPQIFVQTFSWMAIRSSDRQLRQPVPFFPQQHTNPYLPRLCFRAPEVSIPPLIPKYSVRYIKSPFDTILYYVLCSNARRIARHECYQDMRYSRR